ncbi:MAG: hypothetical protein Q8N83_14105 [Ignavibacteria bacterium]|nr:hypothetical protein [Ignavibacteria bacterium]
MKTFRQNSKEDLRLSNVITYEQQKISESKILQIIPATFQKFARYKLDDGSFIYEKIVAMGLIEESDGFRFVQCFICDRHEGITPAQMDSNFDCYTDESN